MSEWQELTPLQAYNGWTLQQLLDLATQHGVDPSDMCVDYGECSSHEVQVLVRRREVDANPDSVIFRLLT